MEILSRLMSKILVMMRTSTMSLSLITYVCGPAFTCLLTLSWIDAAYATYFSSLAEYCWDNISALFDLKLQKCTFDFQTFDSVAVRFYASACFIKLSNLSDTTWWRKLSGWLALIFTYQLQNFLSETERYSIEYEAKTAFNIFDSKHRMHLLWIENVPLDVFSVIPLHRMNIHVLDLYLDSLTQYFHILTSSFRGKN